MATKDYPHGLSADGHDYTCAACGAVIPDGVSVLAHHTSSGKVSGVRAQDADGTVRHECGTKVAKGEGEV